jgi:cysteinyl-tRNA synthetase
LISVHYRARLDWTDEAIERAIQDVTRIHQFAAELKTVKTNPDVKIAPHVEVAVKKFIQDFNAELANDFNSAGALGLFFAFIRDVRRDFLPTDLSAGSLAFILSAVDHANLALGHIHPDPEAMLVKLQALKGADAVDEGWIQSMIEARKAAKLSKDWARADQIRDELKAKNIVLVDNKDGSISWKML